MLFTTVVSTYVVAWCCLASHVLSFQVIHPRAVVQQRTASFLGSEPPTAKRTRRTRRKDADAPDMGDDEEDPPEMMMELKPREAVQMQIEDIRDVVSGKTPSFTERVDQLLSMDNDNDDYEEDDGELADDEEWEYYDENGNVIEPSKLTAIEQMLADAKGMRTEKIEKDGQDFSVESPTSFKNILSTIVTADFFFVCALLVWFLAGIFCSSVLKDDTVQIAFNSNFQMIAQPALGLLMIGSAASAFFKEETEDDVNYDTN
jgi:hypothetical protein